MNGAGPDRRTFLGLGAGLLGVALAPRWLQGRPTVHRATTVVMGTVAEIAVVDGHDARAGAALRAAASELRRVEALMSRFDPASDVGRFNDARVGTRVPVSPETVSVVREAVEWARITDGAFDPTLASLTRAWDPAVVSRPPSRVGLDAARRDARGWSHLEWGTDGTRGWLVRGPGTALDLGGIAKGWGIDRAADVLAALGVEAALVNVGGDLVALGTGPDGRPWRVGVRDPRDPSGVLRTFDLSDAAMATSGDYLRWFEFEGVRYAHILDPSTSAPARTGARSITVTASRAVHADAAATSAYILGAATGAARLARHRSAPRIVHSA